MQSVRMTGFTDLQKTRNAYQQKDRLPNMSVATQAPVSFSHELILSCRKIQFQCNLSELRPIFSAEFLFCLILLMIRYQNEVYTA